MRINKNNGVPRLKEISIVFFIIAASLTLISLSAAKGNNWYDKLTTPAATLTVEAVDTLTTNNQYIWNTTQWWKEGNCYYFDLYIGNETNVTWSDTRRELTCTNKVLSIDNIDQLELSNVAWTLDQVGMTQPKFVEPVKTKSVKAENLKTKTLTTDAGIISEVTGDIIR